MGTWRTTLVAAAIACGVPLSASADTQVSSWLLGIMAQDFASGERQTAFFLNVQNPFVDEHSVALADGVSAVAAQYDISWLLDSGTFDIASQQQARGSSSDTIETIASGGIILSGSDPVPLHVNASWTYALPMDFMVTGVGVIVSDAADPSIVLFNETRTVQTMPGEPASGTLSIVGDVVLPPNQQWRLRYAMSVETFSGTQGYSGTGNGYVNFTITPECSSLALLLLAVPAVGRLTRRRGRR